MRVAQQIKAEPENNWFITLTYSEENITKTKTGKPNLEYRDFQLFMKKLRKTQKEPIKYLTCGEYGSKTGRPHFHSIIFGLKLKDLKAAGENGIGQKYYTSKTIDKTWNKGIAIIGEASYQTANYLTKYTIKKLKKTNYKEIGITEEKLLISKGIGLKYLQENWKKIYEEDKLYAKTEKGLIKSNPIKYYDRKMELIDPEKLKKNQEKRIEKAKIETYKLVKNKNWNYTKLLQDNFKKTQEKIKNQNKRRK